MAEETKTAEDIAAQLNRGASTPTPTAEDKVVTLAVKPPTMPEVAIKPPSIQDALNHIALVRKNLEQYEGQFNMNPFNWLRDNKVNEIEKRLKAGDSTAIAEALKLSPTAVPKTVSVTVDTRPQRK